MTNIYVWDDYNATIIWDTPDELFSPDVDGYWATFYPADSYNYYNLSPIRIFFSITKFHDYRSTTPPTTSGTSEATSTGTSSSTPTVYPKYYSYSFGQFEDKRILLDKASFTEGERLGDREPTGTFKYFDVAVAEEVELSCTCRWDNPDFVFPSVDKTTFFTQKLYISPTEEPSVEWSCDMRLCGVPNTTVSVNQNMTFNGQTFELNETLSPTEMIAFFRNEDGSYQKRVIDLASYLSYPELYSKENINDLNVIRVPMFTALYSCPENAVNLPISGYVIPSGYLPELELISQGAVNSEPVVNGAREIYITIDSVRFSFMREKIDFLSEYSYFDSVQLSVGPQESSLLAAEPNVATTVFAKSSITSNINCTPVATDRDRSEYVRCENIKAVYAVNQLGSAFSKRNGYSETDKHLYDSRLTILGDGELVCRIMFLYTTYGGSHDDSFLRFRSRTKTPITVVEPILYTNVKCSFCYDDADDFSFDEHCTLSVGTSLLSVKGTFEFVSCDEELLKSNPLPGEYTATFMFTPNGSSTVEGPRPLDFTIRIGKGKLIFDDLGMSYDTAEFNSLFTICSEYGTNGVLPFLKDKIRIHTARTESVEVTCEARASTNDGVNNSENVAIMGFGGVRISAVPTNSDLYQTAESGTMVVPLTDAEPQYEVWTSADKSLT